MGRISVAIPGAKSPSPMPMSTSTSDFRLVRGVVYARQVVAPTLAAVPTARSARLVEAPTLAATSASGSGSSPKSSKALTSRTSFLLQVGNWGTQGSPTSAGNSLKFHCPWLLSRHLTPAFRHQPFHRPFR